MVKKKHGGNIYEFEREGIIDFSSNINPMGLSKKVKEAVIRGVDSSSKYPDVNCSGLREALSSKLDISPKSVVFGNGAADIIHRLVLFDRPRRALITAPTFSEYEDALNSVDCKVDKHRLYEKDDFRVSESILEKIEDGFDMVFLCNPNNPTGQLMRKSLLKKILCKCDQLETILVLDECFINLTDEGADLSMIESMADSENLFILRAFTKDFAMAGIRLGYGLSSNTRLIDGIANTGQPWAVSHLAQVAGIQALQEDEYLREAVELIKVEREKICSGLKDMGYQFIPPAANYIFFKLREVKDPEYIGDFFDDMLEAGFLLRDCGNYEGLDVSDGWVRIAVKNPEDNEMLMNAMKERELKWQRR